MPRARRRSTTGPLWFFVIALLLRAAMPLLATASADLRGVALAEVCSVHGTSLDAQPRDSAPVDPAAHHGDKPCALSALAALGTTGTPPRLETQPVAPHAAAPPFAVRMHGPDATIAWIARRKQGPPSLS